MVLAVVLFLAAGLCEIRGRWLVWQVCPTHEAVRHDVAATANWVDNHMPLGRPHKGIS